MQFRPLTRDDFDLIARWLAEPHVAAWWDGPVARDDMEARYGPRIDGPDPYRMFIAELDGVPLGRIQFGPTSTWLPEFAKDVANIDFQIGDPVMVGKGLGPQMIDAFLLQVVFADGRYTRVISDPQADNIRSIRALEKAGFKAFERRKIAGTEFLFMERFRV